MTDENPALAHVIQAMNEWNAETVLEPEETRQLANAAVEAFINFHRLRDPDTLITRRIDGKWKLVQV